VGLSFKPGTDDLRESPMVELAERLLGKGIPLSIYDDDLLPDELVGANARYVHEHLPHLHLLLQADLADALKQVETVVIAKRSGALAGVDLSNKTVIDLSAGPAIESQANASAARRVA
jgi:GDP-mannose 6-dehydrogenase